MLALAGQVCPVYRLQNQECDAIFPYLSQLKIQPQRPVSTTPSKELMHTISLPVVRFLPSSLTFNQRFDCIHPLLHLNRARRKTPYQGFQKTAYTHQIIHIALSRHRFGCGRKRVRKSPGGVKLEKQVSQLHGKRFPSYQRAANYAAAHTCRFLIYFSKFSLYL